MALAILGCVMCQVGLGLTYLFETYLREVVAELGWSRASFSAAYASRFVVLSLASVLAGWATQRLGPRVVLASAPIVEAHGWRASALYLVGGGSLLLLPFAIWAVRWPERTPLRSPTADTRDVPGVSLDLSAALRTRSFWLVFAALFFFYFYYLAVLDHLMAYLQDVGLSRTAASQAFSMTIFLGVASKLGIGVVFDRFHARAGLLLNVTVLTVASMLLILVPAPGVLPAFVIGHGAAVAAQNVTYPVVVAETFGVDHMAEIYGVLMLALMLGGLSGSVLAGAAFDHFGSYRPILVLFAVLNLAALGLLALVRREVADVMEVR